MKVPSTASALDKKIRRASNSTHTCQIAAVNIKVSSCDGTPALHNACTQPATDEAQPHEKKVRILSGFESTGSTEDVMANLPIRGRIEQYRRSE